MKKLLTGAILLAGVAAASPAFAVPTTTVQYMLNTYVGSGTAAAGPYGTVTLAQNGSNVDVSVVLTEPPVQGFVDTGAGSALLFDLLNVPTISFSNLTSGFSFVSTTNGDIHADGSGNWDFAITCAIGQNSTAGACGSGGSSPAAGPLSFTVNNVTIDNFTANGNGNFFASDLCIGGTAATGCGVTGDVVATSGTTTQVPEPSTLALFGAGLLAFWALRRRKFNLV